MNNKKCGSSMKYWSYTTIYRYFMVPKQLFGMFLQTMANHQTVCRKSVIIGLIDALTGRLLFLKHIKHQLFQKIIVSNWPLNNRIVFFFIKDSQFWSKCKSLKNVLVILIIWSFMIFNIIHIINSQFRNFYCLFLPVRVWGKI